MVAHKIPSSFHDQVKGGDGIFIGDYEYKDNMYGKAVLIGESKIWKNYSDALIDSLESVNRFHDGSSSARFTSQEFIVARKGIVKNSEVDLDLLYDHITPGKAAYQQCILVHPTFIMYETPYINTIENTALTPNEAEELLKGYITKRHTKHIELIEEKMAKYPELSKVFLDFFILPVKNVDDFRNQLFYYIHGIDYVEKQP